ncbi:MAG: NAD-dependent epimerase/dehydratase family protein [Candidatus Obscuribacter sp.]|nr:NAD-dependent epimerase/dehydratase family protein [Candidatus Obscuribacter sp.]
MQILIIGGTKFLGRHIVQAALKRGHTVTTFNRGTANLKEQSAVKKLIGDRNKDLSLLKTQSWDAVIDTCGSDPESVQKSCEYLLELTDSYTFISTISVYKDYAGPDQSESLTLKNIDTDKREYGSLKAACEAIVEKLYRQNHQILRPGLIVGPYDPTDRFTYWPGRIARGGKVLAPWSEMPLWVPEDEPDLAGFLAIDSSKARAAGLKFRPLKSTIKDTYDWDLSRSQAEYLAGLSAEREAKLLSQ